MTAGRRDTLIELQGYSASQDEYGEETQTWSALGSAWAAVFYGRGDERRQAAAEQGEQSATFQVLSNAVTRAVSIRNRIVLGSDNWDIVGIAPDTPKRGLIEFTATRAL